MRKGIIIWGLLLGAMAAPFGCGGEGTETSGTSNSGGAGSTSGSAASAASSGSGSTCSSANCTGCCFNNTCQPGNTAAGCGKNGLACQACPMGDICKVEQTCGIDPASMWEVRPVGGSISTTNNGATWDVGGGAPDPFVNLFCPASAAVVTTSTAAAADTFMPTWNTPGCTMSAKDLMTAGVGIEVWDEDGAFNDVIAPKGPLVATEAHLHAGAITATNNTTLLSLTIALTPQ